MNSQKRKEGSLMERQHVFNHQDTKDFGRFTNRPYSESSAIENALMDSRFRGNDIEESK